MKKQIIIPFLLFISLFLLMSSEVAMAESRSIFVGDLINIKVSTENFTEDELRDKFKDFEIVNIKNEAYGYLITLRSFDVGEKTVMLGDKEIKIVVKSTLEEIQRDDIFEGDKNVEESGFYIEWKYVFYIIMAIVLLSGGVNLWRIIKKRKKSLLSPYDHFMGETKRISLDDTSYFVELTSTLKRYLESSYSCSIRGKTSTEIMEEIRGISDLKEILPLIQTWLEESDGYKFSGVIASVDNKQTLLESILEIVKNIEKEKEVKV